MFYNAQISEIRKLLSWVTDNMSGCGYEEVEVVEVAEVQRLQILRVVNKLSNLEVPRNYVQLAEVEVAEVADDEFSELPTSSTSCQCPRFRDAEEVSKPAEVEVAEVSKLTIAWERGTANRKLCRKSYALAKAWAGISNFSPD
ncbi:hypothetical protein B0H13DRAFT_1900965 [Mycena leptocephala]|nr:hypothetical protein B0H13DRAFT_1900965 [Mycena leptocephala]